jgi:hypothetical protein
MKLTAYIVSAEPESGRVFFSLHDGEDTGQVSFIDRITVAHACFLTEHVLGDDQSAYGQMVRAIASTEDIATLVDRQFFSDDSTDS